MNNKDFENHIPLWRGIIGAAFAIFAFWIIDSLSYVDDSMEVGIGIIGLTGIIGAIWFIISVVNFFQRVFSK